MQPPIELETVNPLPQQSRGWPGGGKGHVRSASHGGVSLLNPTLHPQPSVPSPAIGLLEAASGLSKGERASQDVSATTTVPKLPYAGNVYVIFNNRKPFTLARSNKFFVQAFMYC